MGGLCILRGVGHIRTSFLLYGEDVDDGAQYGGDGSGNDDDFAFAPTAFFEMMMNGRHFEDSLFEKLIGADLQDNGDRFDDIDQTDDEDQKRAVGKEGKTGDHTAEEEGARVTHEDSRGIPVIDEEAEHTAEQRAREKVDGVSEGKTD